MNPAKTYYLQRGTAELGPFTLSQLNAMRNRNEISGTDLCRLSDQTEFHPLVAMFPHMANFNRKSPEQHKKEAATTEGNSLANAAWVCAGLSWFIAGPVLGGFAVVMGLKAWVRVRRIDALIAALLGALAIGVAIFRILAP